ncbi:proteasome subunit beta type-9 precursor [Kalaharituber pfeilii]|nr:proteasome subunit beta type-9 precursor [Kalaharituber pfeilii]
MPGGQLDINGVQVDMNHLKKGEVSMAVQFDNGVILGADSRTTTGAYVANRVTDKLTQVHDTIWCCRSGSAADTQAIADMVHYYLQMYHVQNNEPPTTLTAASLFEEICYANKEQIRGEIYLVPLGGSLLKVPYALGGSGSTYIYGYCDANWRENMNQRQAIAFVKEALSQAIKWDGSSGGVIRMLALTKEGVKRLIFFPDEEYKGTGEYS